jgi:hypothetical protein
MPCHVIRAHIILHGVRKSMSIRVPSGKRKCHLSEETRKAEGTLFSSNKELEASIIQPNEVESHVECIIRDESPGLAKFRKFILPTKSEKVLRKVCKLIYITGEFGRRMLYNLQLNDACNNNGYNKKHFIDPRGAYIRLSCVCHVIRTCFFSYI